MVGRWFFLAVVAIGLFAYVKAQGPKAAPATITQTCAAPPRGVETVTFAWPAPRAAAQQTWLDLGLVPGFPAGTFTGHGPFPPSQMRYGVGGVPQGVTFSYRVNTQYPDGWRIVAAGSFVAKCQQDPASVAR